MINLVQVEQKLEKERQTFNYILVYYKIVHFRELVVCKLLSLREKIPINYRRWIVELRTSTDY